MTMTSKQRTPILLRGVVRAVEPHGFTVIELLVVLVVVGILVSIAVPAFLSVRAGAVDTASKASIRAAVPAVEAFASDNIGAKGDADNKANASGYKGMTAALLRSNYDAGLGVSVTVVAGKTTVSQYCLTATENGVAWSAIGPGITEASYRNHAKCK